MPRVISAAEMRANIERLRRRQAQIQALDPSTLVAYDPRVDALQGALDEALYKAFDGMNDRYNRFRRLINWAADIPSIGALSDDAEFQDDVVRGQNEVLIMLAAAIEMLEEELAEQTALTAPSLEVSPRGAGTVFIGHGRSDIWRALKDFLKDRLGLGVEEFNSVPVAGTATAARLNEMLQHASFAFIIMTAEDEQPDGKKRARENVVHEVGLFQGRLGFERAIVLLEEGCGEFSNIHGLGQIRFPKGNIGAAFEEIRRVLEREKLHKQRV